MAKTYVTVDPSGSSIPMTSSGSAGKSHEDTSFSVEADLAPQPTTKEEAKEQWEEFLRDRFIHGRDEDFEYAKVDENDEYDVLERKDQEDAWFEDEDPGWASEGDGGGVGSERRIEGQTGIQDF